MPSSLPGDNLNYPALLRSTNSGGSGFFVRNERKTYLVTARHVIYKANAKALLTNRCSVLINDSGSKAEYILDLSKATIKSYEDVDIAVIEIGSRKVVNGETMLKFRDYFRKTNPNKKSTITVVPRSHLKKFNKITVSNDIFVIGYPLALANNGKQFEIDKPLLRKGVVAGLNSINKTVILDCPVYKGNSGGVVIEVDTENGVNKYYVIGVVSEFIPFVEHLRSIEMGYINSRIENSGYSVAASMDKIIELTKEKADVKVKGK